MVGKLLILAVACIGGTEHQAAQLRPQVIGSINQIDLDRIRDILELSEAQEEFLHAHHAEYLALREETFGPQLKAFYEARSRAMKIGHDESGLTYKEAYELPDRLEAQLNPTLLAMDAAFFEGLKPVLAEHQLERLDRARNGRLRRLYSMNQALPPEAVIDIIELLTPLSATEQDRLDDDARANLATPPVPRETLELTREEADRVEPIIATYEPQVIVARKALRDNERHGRDASMRSMDIHLLLHDDENGLSHAERDAMREEADRLEFEFSKRLKAPALHLVALNRRFLGELKESLPEETAAALQVVYLEIAYPQVYPDVASADEQYEETLQWEALSPEQTEAIAFLYAQYRTQHKRLSAEMAESIALRLSKWLAVEDVLHLHTYWSQLRQLGVERIELNRAQAALIAELLTPDQIEQMPKWKYAGREPPQPWDPRYRPGQEDRRRQR